MRATSVVLGTAASLVLLAGLTPAGAFGGAVAVDQSRLVFAGGGNEENDLTVERLGSSFRVTDDQNDLTAGAGCTANNPHRAVCAAPGINRIQFSTGGGRDGVVVVNSSTPATLDGGAGLDTLTGGAGPDTLIAGTGTQVFGENLNGGDGADKLFGPTNPFTSATLVGASGADTLSGGPGNEQLIGGPGPDDISGGDAPGDQAIYGGVDPLTVTVGAGANDGTAGEGDNVHADIESIVGGSANDVLIGTVGRQHLFGSEGEDSLRGGDGDDLLEGSSDNDVLRGEAGADTVDGDTGADRLFGGDGTDLAEYGDRNDPGIPISVSINDVANDGAPGEGDDVRSDVENVRGGAGADVLTGNARDNQFFGQGGDDQLTGNGGDDRLFGDFTFASGTVGADTLRGGDGADVLNGGGAADVMVGGAATDQADYSGVFNPITVTVGGGANDGEAGEGDNVGADVEIVVGGSGADDIEGGAGPSFLYGNSGPDNLKGGGGDDFLEGENPLGFASPAGDVLNGGPGVDTAGYRFTHSNVTVDLDGVADDGSFGENDNVLPNVENLMGTEGFDSLIGNASANALLGYGGDDTLEGGDGADHLSGGANQDTHEGQGGNDRINSRLDGFADTNNCGVGTDSVVADSLDTSNPDCENVDAP